MASTTASTSLAVTLAQAISYLTRSLTAKYPATTIIKLQLHLEQNLTAQFASSWVPSEPLRGSGRRCLTLSPHTLPPRAVYHACQAAGVEWSHWIALLGGVEFDLFIDPGCVSARFGNWDTGKVTRNLTIWSESASRKAKRSEEQLQAQLRAQAQARSFLPPSPPKTYAQQLIEDDEDEELFAMIADEVREPTWLTPTASDFSNIPTPARSQNSSPISAISAVSRHSRSSSRSSNSSSGFSIFSHDSADSFSSGTTVSSPDDEKPSYKLSRRERARQARVFIDASKNAVTNYDGGKTTVLTGGVMLGAGPTPKKSSSSNNATWRSLCA